MAAYSVVLKASAAKEVENLATRKERQRIVARIRALTADPRPPGCEKLTGATEHYRVRQGRYRVVYSVDDHERLVVVVEVGHRKDVYR
ncbi:MAG: type II toxin-antitoxin system RelE/ParE family toxin [Acidobacteriota bacterium]